MHISPLSTIAITLLFAANTVNHLVDAKVTLLSWNDAYDKAKVLVDKMTLEQKVDITTGIGWKKGVCLGNTFAVEELGFPSLCLQDSPLGVRSANNVTSGVAGINAAASFDKKAIYERGRYMGREFRGKGAHVQLGPAMNFMRSPEGGRGWESEGEDPFLAGVVSAETIKGIQDEGVMATAKHYILNEQELNRKTGSSDVDTRTLHEVYLWPFARSVEAGVASVMCSYNQVNGTYACEDDYILNTVLKGELGFRGFVQSDWGGTHSTAKSVNSGLDMTMPGDIIMGDGLTYFGKNLTKAVEDKQVDESRITDMAMRIVASWYKMRQDTDFPKTALNSFNISESPFVNVQSNHKKLVREMGAASTVFLKNKGTLPIDRTKISKIAVIGSDGGPDPNGINCVNHGCSNGTLAQGWGSGTSYFPYLIDPLAGLSDAVGDNVRVVSSLDDWDLQKATDTAKDADYAFVFSNSDSGEEHVVVDGNVGDRNNISLWHNGDNLIKAVADANKNTIVVIHAVGAVLMPWIDHPNIKAVVWPGLQGQESGNTLADIVFGRVNPSGRLPYTIAKQASDFNVKPDPSQNVVYSEKLLVGYKWFDHAKIEPLFSFGHGLSYTTFDYSKLKISVDKKTSSVKASIVIENTGALDGAEVVQVYLSFPDNVGEPPKHLRGFEKVFLKKGKKETVKFELSKIDVSIWNTVANKWTVPSGKFTLHIGASSRDIRQSASFTV
ncbi:glycoside hydrolase superfamily [Blakeslea trispora]|nr:glycoside hydrolase superfamily [Blakeslea trispora]